MNFWIAVLGWLAATLIVIGALSINGVTETPAGGAGHGHGDDGHGHDDHGHGSQAHGGHGH